jgi:hypothetical protein
MKIQIRSSKLVVDGGKCILIIQVARMVLDARCWDYEWK